MHYAICSISLRCPILDLLIQGVLKCLETLLPESGGSCLNVRRTSSHETFWLEKLAFSKMLSRCAASVKVTSAIKHYLSTFNTINMLPIITSSDFLVSSIIVKTVFKLKLHCKGLSWWILPLNEIYLDLLILIGLLDGKTICMTLGVTVPRVTVVTAVQK